MHTIQNSVFKNVFLKVVKVYNYYALVCVCVGVCSGEGEKNWPFGELRSERGMRRRPGVRRKGGGRRRRSEGRQKRRRLRSKERRRGDFNNRLHVCLYASV